MRSIIGLRVLLAAAVLALSVGAIAIPAAGAAELTFELHVANGRLPQNMRLIRVKRNDVVRLKWSTDSAMSVHLHGYDIEAQLKPGVVTEMTFIARAAGRFTIEPHIRTSPSGGHAHGDVLVTIEVLP